MCLFIASSGSLFRLQAYTTAQLMPDAKVIMVQDAEEERLTNVDCTRVALRKVHARTHLSFVNVLH